MLDVGMQAPSFVLKGIDGATYDLREAAQRGPLLLVFFSATCGACHTAFPYYNRLRQAYPQDRWQLWAISQDGLEMAQWYAKRHGLAFPVLVDEESWPVSKAYDPPSTPAFYLLDGDRKVVAANAGFSKDDLNELARLLAGWLGQEPQVVAPADDGNPPFRPGCVPRHHEAG